MGRPFGRDMRLAVIFRCLLIAGGCAAAASHVGNLLPYPLNERVPKGRTARRWMQQYKDSLRIEALRASGNRGAALSPCQLEQFGEWARGLVKVTARMGRTFSRNRFGKDISRSAVCRYFKKLGISRKRLTNIDIRQSQDSIDAFYQRLHNLDVHPSQLVSSPPPLCALVPRAKSHLPVTVQGLAASAPPVSSRAAPLCRFGSTKQASLPLAVRSSMATRTEASAR